MRPPVPAPTAGGPAPRRRWLRWVNNVAGPLIIVAFLYYLWVRRADLIGSLAITPTDLAWLGVGSLLTTILNSTQTYFLYRAVGIQIGYVESFLLMMAAAFGNYLPMRTGTLFRMHYMKRVHGLRYARFGSVFGVRVVLMLGGTGLAGLLGTFAIALTGGRLSEQLLVIFGLMTLGSVGVWLLPLPRLQSEQGRLRRILGDFFEGIALLRRHPRIGLITALLVLAQYWALAWRFHIAAVAMGTETPFALLAILGPVAGLSGFVAVTPGGIGLREGLMGYVTYAAGASFDRGLYIGTVDRTVQLATVAIIGGGSFLYLWLRVRSRRE